VEEKDEMMASIAAKSLGYVLSPRFINSFYKRRRDQQGERRRRRRSRRRSRRRRRRETEREYLVISDLLFEELNDHRIPLSQHELEIPKKRE